MIVGVPIVIVTMACAGAVVSSCRGRAGSSRARCRPDGCRRAPEARVMTTGERNVMFAFSVTVALWVLPGVLSLALRRDAPRDATVRRARCRNRLRQSSAGCCCSSSPISWRERRFTLSWAEASRIDWGIVLLFGGGLAMGRLLESTGLSAALGQGIAAQFPGRERRRTDDGVHGDGGGDV